MKWFQGFVAETNNGFRVAHETARVDQMNSQSIKFKHAHNRYEIYYLISGNVNYTVGGNVYHINPGEIVILNLNTLHQVEVMPDTFYERCDVEFTSQSIPVINGINPIKRFFNLNSLIHIIPKEIVDTSNIKELLNQMESSYKEDDEYRNHMLSSLITLYVIEVAKLINKEQSMGYNYIKVEDRNTEIINQTIQYINDNIGKDLSVETISLAVGYSRSYLQHIFKDIVGTPISTYVLSQKMHTANFLLQNGTPIQIVADDLGFKYYSTFSATYKKFFGYSPKERKNNK